MKFPKLLIGLFMLVVLGYACRKTEHLVKPPPDNPTINAFLSLPANADPVLVRITDALRKKETAHPFIEKLTALSGNPQWAFAEVKLSAPLSRSSVGEIVAVNNTRHMANAGNGQDTTVLIPFVYNSAKRVNAFLAVHLSDSMPIKLFTAKDFESTGYTKDGNRPTARSIAMRFMAFDYGIFKTPTFRIADKDLALSLSGGRDTVGLFSFADQNNNSTDKPTINYMLGIEVCTGGSWIVDPNAYWDTYTQEHPPLMHVDGECNTEWYNMDEYSSEVNLSGIVISNGGGTYAPNPYGDEDRAPESWEATDGDGYYEFRKNALQDLAAIDPMTPLPCPELNIMPLDDNGNGGYGLMFKPVAQRLVPPGMVSRMEGLANTPPSSPSFSIFNVQNLENATGGAVNCDYFPVLISALPTGMTGADLLEFFRKNTNTFIDPNVSSVTFAPYVYGNVDETSLYNSSFEASLGSLVHIHMANDGTVILSDYYRSTSPYKARFTFSTVKSPYDGFHPVSGNREFGIFQNPSGGYTFYTMGVDRTANWVFSLLNTLGTGFNAADKLWGNIQDMMVAYIKSHGGQAVKQKPVIARPNWRNVDKYLRGQITFTQLKHMLGCY